MDRNINQSFRITILFLLVCASALQHNTCNAVGGNVAWSYKMENGVRAVSISREGQYFAAGGIKWVGFFSRDRVTPIWMYRSNFFKEDVNSLTVSGDGESLVVGVERAYLHYFAANKSSPLWSLSTIGPVLTVSVSYRGEYVAAGVFEGVIYLLDRSGKLLWNQSAGSPSAILSVSISRDGEYMVAGSSNSKLMLFSRASSMPLWIFEDNDSIRSVSISDDGRYIAAGGNNSNIYLFERGSSKPIWSYKANGPIRSVYLSPDGSHLAAGSLDQKVYYFARSNPSPLWTYQTGGIVVCVATSENGSYCCAGSSDRNAYFFDLNGSLIWAHKTNFIVSSISLSGDGTAAAAGSGNEIYLLVPDRASKTSGEGSEKNLVGPLGDLWLPLLLGTVLVTFVLAWIAKSRMGADCNERRQGGG